MQDAGLVLSLVRAHLMQNPDYMSWVPAYTVVRWSHKGKRPRAHESIVGGHYRRKAMYGRMLSALSCTCKLQDLVMPVLVVPPSRVKRARRDEEGDLTPRDQRHYLLQ